MTNRVDIRVTVDGVAIPLPTDVATMVLAVVDHREAIHRQGAGIVMVDYLRENMTISLLRRNYQAKARKLTMSAERDRP